VTRTDIEAYLDRHRARLPGTKIQYGHPSPRYWRPSEADLPELLADAVSDRKVALYLHIPFCVPTEPGACGFCLFAREDFSSYPLLRRYVGSLITEMERVAAVLGPRELGSVYFGGGTPNLLRPEEITALFDALFRQFTITPATEITFEGYPPLFTPDRLEALAEAGCTRISLGVQTLDSELLLESGRTQDTEQIRNTIRFARDAQMRCSADLITGWFGQGPSSIERDVDTLLDWGITGLVNHPLMIGGDSDFARRAEALPSVQEQAQTFAAATARLLARGFRMDSYTDYCAADIAPVSYLDMYRDVLAVDRIGVGYGANSLLAGTPSHPGSTWANVRNTGEYQQRVDAGHSAIDERFAFAAQDLRLLYVLKGIEGTPWIDAAAYAHRFGRDLRSDYAPVWDALEGMGWLRWDGDGPRLMGDGVFHTAQVQRCISEPRNCEL